MNGFSSFAAFSRLGAVMILSASLLSACGGGSGTGTREASAAASTQKKALAVSLASAAATDVQVVDLVKVSEVRVSRTVFDFTFQVRVRNTGGTTYDNLGLTIDAAGAGATVRDGVVALGTLAAGATTLAVDTVTIRQDRTYAFNAAALVWRIDGTPKTFGFTKQERKQVDFGTGANHFAIKAASAGSGGEVELRLDSANGPVIGRVYTHHTGSPVYFLEYETKLNATVTGVRDVYFNILDYAAPVAGGVLQTGDFKFSLRETDAPVSDARGLSVYSAVPGLNSSPYYEIHIQEKSKLNSSNLAAVTNWISAFAWFTEVPKEGSSAASTGAFYSGFIGGWSHTFTNFQLAPNTPIVVKITRKLTNSSEAPAGPIENAEVYPARKIESKQVIDGAVYITMKNPAQITVDIDGQMDTRDAPRAKPTGWPSGDAFPYVGPKNGAHAVSIFANPFITPPDKSDPGVLVIKAGQKLPANLSELDWHTLYFDSGVHNASVNLDANGEVRWRPEDQIPIISNRSYYIAGDAIVYGNFTDFNRRTPTTQNVRFFGHGVISGEKIHHYKSWPGFGYTDNEYPNSQWHRGIVMRAAENSHIEGITSLNAANHNIEIESSNTREYTANSVKWVKVIGWRANGDGASVGGRVTVEDCFFRTQDDAHYIGGAVPLRRIVFWNDVNGQAFRAAHAKDRIRIDDALTFPKQIVIEDIDVIYARGVFDTDADDGVTPITGLLGEKDYALDGRILANGVVNNGQMIIFRNVLISDPRPSRPLFVFDARNIVGGYAGFRFENVTYAGKPAFKWKHTLLGGAAGLRHFVFDNVSIDGKKIDINYLNDPVNFRMDRVFDLTFRTREQVSPTPYTLTRTATNGSIAIDPPPPGSDQLTVRATPMAGFMFIGWGGDASGTDSIATITMNRDKAITANFAPLSPP